MQWDNNYSQNMFLSMVNVNEVSLLDIDTHQDIFGNDIIDDVPMFNFMFDPILLDKKQDHGEVLSA